MKKKLKWRFREQHIGQNNLKICTVKNTIRYVYSKVLSNWEGDFWQVRTLHRMPRLNLYLKVPAFFFILHWFDLTKFDNTLMISIGRQRQHTEE